VLFKSVPTVIPQICIEEEEAGGNTFWLCSKINKAVFNFHAFPCGMNAFGVATAAESSMVPKAAIAATKTKAITMTHTPTDSGGK